MTILVLVSISPKVNNKKLNENSYLSVLTDTRKQFFIEKEKKWTINIHFVFFAKVESRWCAFHTYHFPLLLRLGITKCTRIEETHHHTNCLFHHSGSQLSVDAQFQSLHRSSAPHCHLTSLQSSPSMPVFRQRLKTFLVRQSFPNIVLWLYCAFVDFMIVLLF